MNTRTLRVLAGFLLLGGVAELLRCAYLCGGKPPAPEAGQPWSFAVSGDSRNCGDVVMPAIAAGALHDQAAFYWHLGDLRAIYKIDEDMQQMATRKGKPLTRLDDYRARAWDDFRDNQITPFGEMPFYLGIGNHETIFRKRGESLLRSLRSGCSKERTTAGPRPEPTITGKRVRWISSTWTTPQMTNSTRIRCNGSRAS